VVIVHVFRVEVIIQVVFKKLEKSEIGKNIALERMQAVVARFPELRGHQIKITLEMENSRLQAGPDVFTAKLFINGDRFRSIVIEKSASNLYAAMADVVEHTLERLNRYGDKSRVRQRKVTTKRSTTTSNQTSKQI
jgi:ribosome-associated translation inhibitor RaiA